VKSYLEALMGHLTLVLQRCFQFPMFQLIAYSLSSKLRFLQKSCFQLRDELTVNALATGLDLAPVWSSISGRQSGNRFAGSVASCALLNSVDSMSCALPHSNEAAKVARSHGEAMQHVLGTPSIFLTVCFDDQNSFLMQIMSGHLIDEDVNISDLADADLANCAVERKQLRLEHPGLGSLNFELLLEIVVEEVIGWNMRDHIRTDDNGLFGECEGVAGAMEEQGRHTVHVHFSIWIKVFPSLGIPFFWYEARKSNGCQVTARLLQAYFVNSPDFFISKEVIC
jgi:hypothetical protein